VCFSGLQGSFVAGAAQAVAHKLCYCPVHGAVAALQFGVSLHALFELSKELQETLLGRFGGKKVASSGESVGDLVLG
jgi:hypothetical protein